MLKATLISFVFLFTLSFSATAQKKSLQPYSSYWFIEELLKWSPEKDPDAIFNVSKTPLAEKHFNPNYKMNVHAHANEAKVNILPIFGNTSGNPSQGSLDSSYYAFTYWQYCDLMVFWGGSSAEGIILSPNPGVIDAAHRHGVPVYGTVFFPPIVYGGKREWVYDFVKKENGRFPVADKLIEVAKFYGFDGWFINQESGNVNEVKADSTLATAMRDFMIYYQEQSDLGMEWYDAMMTDGLVHWQHELNEKNDMFFQHGNTKVADYMFLDFRSTAKKLENTAIAAKKANRNLYDIFASVDVQSNGYDSKPGYKYPQGANFDVIFPEGKAHAASLGIYVPSWTYHSSKSLGEFHKKENRLWVGEHLDPRKTETEHNWKGIAHYIPAKSTINKLPFVTNFCTGQGKKFFLNGKDITPANWTKGWNNMSLQAIQPTWRWVSDVKGGKVNIGYDFSNAYNGGNSLHIEGKAKETVLKLFSTQLNITSNSELTVAYSNRKKGKLSVVLHLANGKVASFPLSSKTKGWKNETISLKSIKDQTVECISIKLESKKARKFDALLGQIGIVIPRQKTVEQPTNLKVIASQVDSTGTTGSLRLKFDTSKSENIFCYNIYQRNSDNSISFLGATTANAYYIPSLELSGKKKVQIEVEAMSLDFKRSDKATIIFDF